MIPKHSTMDIIRTTLRNLRHKHAFMPGAEQRIAEQLDQDWLEQDRYVPSWVNQAERLINDEKVTLKRLNDLNVTITVLIGWQLWMIYRDEIP